MKKSSLAFELLIILAFKLLLIYAIWSTCFSHPIDKNLQAADIASHLTQ